MEKDIEKNVEPEKEFVQEKPADIPSKSSKKILIVPLILIGVLFVGFIVLGYFYYSKLGQYKTAISERNGLKTELEAKTKELDEVKGSMPDTGPIEEQIINYKAKIGKAQTYNDFFKYLNSVIEIHNGFTGWTDAEYQTGRGLAQKAGDSSFLGVVDNAWNNQQQPVTDRMVSVWKSIQKGIENSLK